MNKDANADLSWAGLSVIATVARLLCRKISLQNKYLRAEDKRHK